MAEGTAAATATPSGGPRSKGGSSMPFWKSLTSRKKSKDAPSVAAPRPPAEPSEMSPPTPPSPSDSRENQQQPGSGSRRNLKVSRSGRFKEKRRCRCPLPTDNPQQLFEGAAPATAPAVRPGGEAPCQ